MITLANVVAALSLALDPQQAQRHMAPRPRTMTRPPAKPGRPVRAGVLLLLYPRAGELYFVLTRRTERVNNHRGQISLPGGRQELGEQMHETALRETCEELGVCLEPAQLLGQLAPLYIPPSDFEIYPFVAHYTRRPSFVLEPAEVAELFEVPLERLLARDSHFEETWQIRGLEVDVPYYRFEDQVVWGATAMVLSEFETRLRVVLGSEDES